MPLAGAGISADEAMPVLRDTIGGDHVVGLKDETGAIIPLSMPYSPEHLGTLEKVRNTPVVAAG